MVGNASTQDAITERVAQIKNLIEAAGQAYEKEKLNERIVKLSGGVAVIQGGKHIEMELKEKKLTVEDALNVARAAIEEGNVVGGGWTLLRLATKFDEIKATLTSDEEKVGAEYVRRALSYPLNFIAEHETVNGSVVCEKQILSEALKYREYDDLMAPGIIDDIKFRSSCYIASDRQTQTSYA